MSIRVVLHVTHEDKSKMVGKVFSIFGKDAFFHESSGSQWHAATNSPGGVDVAVLDWLKDRDIRWVRHFDKKRKTLYSATVGTIISNGVTQQSDGRARKYLAVDHWKVEKGPLRFRIPWIDDIVRIDVDTKKPETFNQLSLF